MEKIEQKIEPNKNHEILHKEYEGDDLVVNWKEGNTEHKTTFGDWTDLGGLSGSGGQEIKCTCGFEDVLYENTSGPSYQDFEKDVWKKSSDIHHKIIKEAQEK